MQVYSPWCSAVVLCSSGSEGLRSQKEGEEEVLGGKSDVDKEKGEERERERRNEKIKD